MPGAGLERGDDITDIQTLGRRLDAGHKTPLQAPGLCAVAKSLEAATFVLARKRALHAYRVGRLARQGMKHVVAGKAENIVNAVVFAAFHRFVAAVIHPHRGDDGNGTRSLRFSYTSPPLQLMPKHDEELAPLI